VGKDKAGVAAAFINKRIEGILGFGLI